MRYAKSNGNGRLQREGQCWTWVTPALVPLVLRGGFCYGWKCGTSMSSKDASFWWVNLDNNWVTQVYSHMSSGGKHSWSAWSGQGKHHLWERHLYSAVPVSSSIDNINWMEKNYQLLNRCPVSPVLNFMQLSLYTILVFTCAFLMELNV